MKLNKILKLSALATLASFSTNALAVVNPANLVKPGYWYEDEDIRAVLNSRLNLSTSYIATALPFESKDLLKDVFLDSVNEARTLGAALIPVNFSNSHWAALAIKRTKSGGIKVIYNDSLGSSIDSKSNGKLLAEILHEIDPTINIIDLKVHQQKDGSSCGAFTAENLITIAELDVSNLSDDQLRSVLGKINNAALIRNSHFSVLYEGDGVFDVTELKPRAESVANELKSQNRQIIRSIVNLNTLTHDRLATLNRSGNIDGISSGEDELIHGVWVQGFAGLETNKDSIKVSGSTNKTSSKANTQGFLVGADTKIDEDTTVGIAYSNSNTQTKQKIEGTLTNTDKINSNIFAVYGSSAIDDDLTLNGNIAFGKVIVKTNNGTSLNSSKQKGDLLGGSLIASYRLFANESIEVTPRLGASYNQLSMKSHDDGSIKVSKINQKEININTGVSLITFFDLGHLTLIPELSADYSHSVWKNGGGVLIKNQLDQLVFSQKNKSKNGYFKLGTSLTIASDSIELGGGYSQSISGKNRAHIGYAKLRVNF